MLIVEPSAVDVSLLHAGQLEMVCGTKNSKIIKKELSRGSCCWAGAFFPLMVTKLTIEDDEDGEDDRGLLRLIIEIDKEIWF